MPLVCIRDEGFRSLRLPLDLHEKRPARHPGGHFRAPGARRSWARALALRLPSGPFRIRCASVAAGLLGLSAWLAAQAPASPAPPQGPPAVQPGKNDDL